MDNQTFRAIGRRFQQRRQYRNLLREMRKMDTHELDDIGLSAACLPDIAYQATHER